MIEPTSVEKAIEDEFWVEVMQDELNQFTRNDFWELVPCTSSESVVGTKWVFKKKVNDLVC